MIEAIANNKGNSSIAEGVNFLGQTIDFKGLLLINILPTNSPDFFFKFFILISALFFFKIFINPIRVGLQLIFFISSLDLAVNKVNAIKGAAEDGSPGIFKLKFDKFFFPFKEIKFPFLISLF